MPYAIEPMHEQDIPQVIRIEEACFTMPWSAASYKRELKDQNGTRYIIVRNYADDAVVQRPAKDTNISEEKKPLLATLLPFLFNNNHENDRPRNPYPIVGYAGLWLMMDEAHITSIAVAPEAQGKGLGELLLVGLTDIAIQMGASWLTLEVRVSNTVAQNLYRKYTFQEAGVRKKYYTDNNEDAYIMWSEEITKPAFREKYAKLKHQLFERLSREGGLVAESVGSPIVQLPPSKGASANNVTSE